MVNEWRWCVLYVLVYKSTRSCGTYLQVSCLSRQSRTNINRADSTLTIGKTIGNTIAPTNLIICMYSSILTTVRWSLTIELISYVRKEPTVAQVVDTYMLPIAYPKNKIEKSLQVSVPTFTIQAPSPCKFEPWQVV
jgi:hypothetical protein